MGDRRSGKHRRPPSGCQHSTVPSWEKRFCYSTCSISWGKLLEAKKLMEFYQNILQWDDSAGEEAFQNAKARFWAKINQLPCDISLPGPDIYIDEVDWDCEVDPELLKDLDQRVPHVDDEEKVRGRGYLTVGWDNPPPCTGWGDLEDPIQPTGWGDAEGPIQPTGWGDAEGPIQPTGWDNAIEPSGWGDTEYLIQPTGWGDAEQLLRPTGWGDFEDPVQQVPAPSTNFDRENKWWRDEGVDSCHWGQRQNRNDGPKIVNVRKSSNSSTLRDWNLKNAAVNEHLPRYKVLRQQGGGRKWRGTAGGERWAVERQRQLAL